MSDHELKELLKEYGYKFTEQRNAVLSMLFEHMDGHLSTEEIYEAVKKTYPEIGISTVYRTLLLLVRIGLVSKLDLDDGFNRYELVKQNEDHRHHHLICNQCGMIQEVQEDLLNALEEQILLKNKFLVNDHRVKFYGLCENCRSRN